MIKRREREKERERKKGRRRDIEREGEIRAFTKLGSRKFCDSGYSDLLSLGPFDLAKAHSFKKAEESI